MEKIRHLLLENKAWAQSKRSLDPDFFKNSAQDQSPDYFWIGCSDSRVPESEIMNTDPGQMFVHRNIANLVIKDDSNLLSVIEYAVLALKIKHIIICGHYGCGGVKASFGRVPFPVVDQWIEPIRHTYKTHETTFTKLTSESDRINHLVELNVLEQVENLKKVPMIQEAWKSSRYPILHGWVYDLGKGLIKQLNTYENY